MILSHLLFFYLFHWGCAKKKIDDSDHVKEVDVEKILRELSAERAKNRDLNQTISDILERISNMEDDIETNRLRITENRSFMMVVSDDVTVLTDEVTGVEDDVIHYDG